MYTRNKQGWKCLPLHKLFVGMTNCRVKDGKATISFQHILANSQVVRLYHRSAFVPFLQDPGLDHIFNLFDGFHHVTNRKKLVASPEKLALILAHLRDTIAGGQLEVFEFLLGWMAHLIQRPAQKPGVALVLQGPQGSGKGMICELLKRVVGAHYTLDTSNIAHVTGRFNAATERVLLAILDEVDNYGAGYRNSDPLKKLITDVDVRVEPKYMESYSAKSYSRYIFVTNNDYPLKIEASGLRCVGDVQYLKALAQACDEQGAFTLFHFHPPHTSPPGHAAGQRAGPHPIRHRCAGRPADRVPGL